MFGSKSISGAAAESNATIEALGRSQAIIEFKPDGTIITANENFLAAMGCALAEIKGRHHSMFVDENDRPSPAYTKEIAANMNTAAAGVQAITTNMGQIATATQSATEATGKVRQASQELAA